MRGLVALVLAAVAAGVVIQSDPHVIEADCDNAYKVAAAAFDHAEKVGGLQGKAEALKTKAESVVAVVDVAIEQCNALKSKLQDTPGVDSKYKNKLLGTANHPNTPLGGEWDLCEVQLPKKKAACETKAGLVDASNLGDDSALGDFDAIKDKIATANRKCTQAMDTVEVFRKLDKEVQGKINAQDGNLQKQKQALLKEMRQDSVITQTKRAENIAQSAAADADALDASAVADNAAGVKATKLTEEAKRRGSQEAGPAASEANTAWTALETDVQTLESDGAGPADLKKAQEQLKKTNEAKDKAMKAASRTTESVDQAKDAIHAATITETP